MNFEGSPDTATTYVMLIFGNCRSMLAAPVTLSAIWRKAQEIHLALEFMACVPCVPVPLSGDDSVIIVCA
jgi:hypothetical protein